MDECRFVFGLAAVPDVEALRQVYRVDAQLKDADVVDYALQRQRALAGVDELPAHLLKAVALSWIDLSDGELAMQSFASPEFGEGALLGLLLERLDCAPGVAWDAGGRELAVLARRKLLHPGLQRSGLFLSSERVLSLSSELGLPSDQALSARDEIAQLLGAPYLSSLNPVETWLAWNAGHSERVIEQCESGVLKTAMLWLRAASLDSEEAQTSLRARLAVLSDEAGKPLPSR